MELKQTCLLGIPISAVYPDRWKLGAMALFILVVVDTDLSLLFVRDGASRDGAGVGQSSNSCHGMVH
ncbi:hypothetical protein PVK06_034467 [Gossypium arboreum]|uniref:Uncharacterized protein n=1 Tax=Gossypium arboreum TaxID=29729 RepID=A0ABR0NGD8_GOSAR|nr:hypothetical protein PVK06_034467 [Gossypium arboreum]